MKLYRWQIRRILKQTLYFLEIQADGKTLHKIGVTRRTIGDRLPEIERDLRQHYQNISISIIGTWQHRGNVELYFKHRYKAFNYPISTLTEYFKFEKVKTSLLFMSLKRFPHAPVFPVNSEFRFVHLLSLTVNLTKAIAERRGKINIDP